MKKLIVNKAKQLGIDYNPKNGDIGYDADTAKKLGLTMDRKGYNKLNKVLTKAYYKK